VRGGFRNPAAVTEPEGLEGSDAKLRLSVPSFPPHGSRYTRAHTHFLVDISQHTFPSTTWLVPFRGHDRARWQRAFSPDNGKTWEVNWVMEFSRVS
jgi:hypothetical protein